MKDCNFYDLLHHHSVFFLRRKRYLDWTITRIGGWATRDILEVYDTHDSDTFQDWAKEKLREQETENQTQKLVINLLINTHELTEQERWSYKEECSKGKADHREVQAILEILKKPLV